jgi:hypothetical protein
MPVDRVPNPIHGVKTNREGPRNEAEKTRGERQVIYA